MTVGIARITIFIPDSHSLKEKRMVLRRVKDRTRQKFNVAIAEVEENDVWQRGVLGLALWATRGASCSRRSTRWSGSWRARPR
jgi:uncharacterized protein YlxP (DUF503 family)